jgi:transcriptional regulator with XRE-family HTH domain
MPDRDSARPVGPQIRIRDLREAHGLSVNGLIERIAENGVDGVHPDTIRNIELGYKRASKPLMTAWAKALGISSLNVWQPEPLKSSRERVA